MAAAAGYGLLAKQVPPFVVVPAVTVTRDNLSQAWQESLHRALPGSLATASR